MQSEVAEIERGLNVKFFPVEVKEPTKGAKRENPKNKSNQAKPNRPILFITFSRNRRFYCGPEFAAGRFRPTGRPDWHSGHEEKKRNADGCTDDARNK